MINLISSHPIISISFLLSALISIGLHFRKMTILKQKANFKLSKIRNQITKEQRSLEKKQEVNLVTSSVKSKLFEIKIKILDIDFTLSEIFKHLKLSN